MTKACYVGIDGVARGVKYIYYGVEGIARRVSKGYVGVGGIARPFLASESTFEYCGKVSSLSVAMSSINVATMKNSLLVAGGYTAVDATGNSGGEELRIIDFFNKDLTRVQTTTAPGTLSVATTWVMNYRSVASAFSRQDYCCIYSGSSTLNESSAGNVTGMPIFYAPSLTYTLGEATSDVPSRAANIGEYSVLCESVYRCTSKSVNYQDVVCAYSAAQTRTTLSPLGVSGGYAYSASNPSYAVIVAAPLNENAVAVGYSSNLTKTTAPSSTYPTYASFSLGDYSVFFTSSSGNTYNYYAYSRELVRQDFSCSQTLSPGSGAAASFGDVVFMQGYLGQDSNGYIKQPSAGSIDSNLVFTSWADGEYCDGTAAAFQNYFLKIGTSETSSAEFYAASDVIAAYKRF